MLQINENLQKFKSQGYCLFEQAFSLEDQAVMVSEVDTMLANDAFSSDLLSIDKSGKTHKILYPLAKSEKLLKYIVSPTILEVLMSLVEDYREIVLTWEDILIKVPYHGIPVTLHQDLALQSAKHDIFSFGIYMHDSSSNPVYYLPESFKYGALTKNELYTVSKENVDKFSPVIAHAGDMSLHYVKTIHYSDTNASPNPRFTWYIEFRTLKQLYEDSPWDHEWIMKRRAIFVYALQKYAPEHLDKLAPDLDALQPYLQNIDLRVPHTNDTVQYDMKSPYNHFA